MRNINLYLSGLVILLSVFVSCNNNSVSNKVEITVEPAKNVNETELLLNFIEKSGNLINTKTAPFLIFAEEVSVNTNEYLIIDIRDTASFEEAHIENAVIVSEKKLVEYLSPQNDLSTYKKIVIACYAGQRSTYYATLLRFIGYGNVYSLKWGMSAWNNSISDNSWKKNISSNYIFQLELTENPKATKGNYPIISTGKSNGYDIMKARVEKLTIESFKKAKIKADALVENPDKYYIISYWPKDIYLKGHIKGSIQYSPRKSLDRNTFLSSLPTDKPIAVYCYSGHHSSAVVAYLRVLGYDAYNVVYGANSFMYQKMLNGIGHAFNPASDIGNYPVAN